LDAKCHYFGAQNVIFWTQNDVIFGPKMSFFWPQECHFCGAKYVIYHNSLRSTIRSATFKQKIMSHLRNLQDDLAGNMLTKISSREARKKYIFKIKI
jgi:GH43 family beta-xylosidase